MSPRTLGAASPRRDSVRGVVKQEPRLDARLAPPSEPPLTGPTRRRHESSRDFMCDERSRYLDARTLKS